MNEIVYLDEMNHAGLTPEKAALIIQTLKRNDKPIMFTLNPRGPFGNQKVNG